MLSSANLTDFSDVFTPVAYNRKRERWSWGMGVGWIVGKVPGDRSRILENGVGVWSIGEEIATIRDAPPC